MAHTAMRNFHSSLRLQMMDETKDEVQLDKLWKMNELSSGLPFDGRTVDIPSDFLMPVLKPVKKEEESKH